MLNRRWVLAAIVLLPAALGEESCFQQRSWTQWGQSQAHDGSVRVDGQHNLRTLERLIVDPFAAQESAEAGGQLLVHYPVPLLDGAGNVFVLEKAGTYTSCDPPGSGVPEGCGPASQAQEVWTQRAYRWQNGRLVPRWTFASDWKPIPTPWEPLFQAAMTERSIFVPGAGGTVFQVDKRTGATIRRFNPFGTPIDPSTFVSGGLTVDRLGNLLYNVVRFEEVNGVADAHSWLVRVSRLGQIRMVDYRTLIPGAPSATDLCFASFASMTPPPPRPWPPAPDAVPPQFPCGSQRAGIDVTLAIGADGTLFTVTRASGARANDYAYLVALRPDLSLEWATSLRGLLDDGCGVQVPFGNGPFDCREGTSLGVDPSTNMPPAGQVSDLATSSPVALPDGGVLYAAFTAYNGFRGHLMKFDRDGRFVRDFDYGWDVTPAIFEHDGTYSILIPENHFSTNGPFLVTRLDADLGVEWQLANTSTETCERLPDGSVSCVDTGEHPDGFEWGVDAPAIDESGTVYATSQDGSMYAIDASGSERERVFLTRTLSAAGTPLAIDARGRVYAQNNGELHILGR